VLAVLAPGFLCGGMQSACFFACWLVWGRVKSVQVNVSLRVRPEARSARKVRTALLLYGSGGVCYRVWGGLLSGYVS
jgi:hypothetical protein